MIIFASDFTLVLPICVQSYKKNYKRTNKKTKIYKCHTNKLYNKKQ